MNKANLTRGIRLDGVYGLALGFFLFMITHVAVAQTKVSARSVATDKATDGCRGSIVRQRCLRRRSVAI
jgi:hypothetical protein